MTQALFELNIAMVNQIAEIVDKIARLEEKQLFDNVLHLRRENRILTIRSTTAIENNTLSLKQVTDVINGKIVIGKADQITEVKNAFRAYERIRDYEPYNIDSFLLAHSYLTDSLIESSGRFRSGDVGVFDGDNVVHIGARPQYIHNLLAELFEWAKNTDAHPLLISAVVHYEIEYIHPFDDGNGRIGRLWQTVLLYNWRKIFEYLPIENMVFRQQENYYKAIRDSKKEGVANKFIMFMLTAINETLDNYSELQITDIITDIITDKLTSSEKKALMPLVRYLLKYDFIDNSKAQELTGKGVESIKKYLRRFTELDILVAIGKNKGRKYELNYEVLKNDTVE